MAPNIYTIANNNKKIEFEAVSLLLTMINMAPFYMCTLYSFYKRLNRQMI